MSKKKILMEASKEIPLLLAPNMSIGVNASLRSIYELSKVLSGYEVSIEETHHKNKLDSPSGTALKIAEVIAEARQSNPSEINIKSFREEGEVGVHKLFLDHQTMKLLFTITLIIEQFLHKELLIHHNGYLNSQQAYIHTKTIWRTYLEISSYLPWPRLTK